MGTTEAVDEIVVRPYRDGDAEFRARVVRRLHPGPTVSPRDPGALGDWIDRLGRNELELAAGAETFVAETAGQAMGLLILHPEADYFTGHRRAYVDALAVAEEAEGRGVAGALMGFAERWAMEHDCLECCLDVFAGNTRAIGFYEKAGFRPDAIRMAKRLAPR